eukprot:6176354-Pleurochrysis_carterae.AAC.2
MHLPSSWHSARLIRLHCLVPASLTPRVQGFYGSACKASTAPRARPPRLAELKHSLRCELGP